jgi:DNA-binding NarL/FixJ family response regulator
MNQRSSDPPDLIEPSSRQGVVLRDVSAEPSEPHRIRILIADDHIVVLEGLIAIIGRQSDMAVVGQASNGQDAVAQWCECKPDVSLLDLRMPILDGVGAIDAIRQMQQFARIVVLTTFDSDEDIERAIQAGAKAYLLKDSPRDVLLDCIRKVHAGKSFLPPRSSGKPIAPK